MSALQITPEAESSDNGVMRFHITATMPFTSANISISNTEDYTVSFEDEFGNVFAGEGGSNVIIDGVITLEDLREYDIVVRRIAGTELERLTVAMAARISGIVVNATSTVLFTTPPTPTITLNSPTSRSTTTTADVSFTVTDIDGPSVNIKVEPVEFIIAVVSEYGQNYPGTGPVEEELQIDGITEEGLDGYHLVITRPPGSTSEAVVTVKMEIGSVISKTQVKFADISPSSGPGDGVTPGGSPSATDLRNTSTAGLLLLTSAAVLCAVSMTQKLNRGIFFISLMTAFTGIVFLV